MEFLDATGGGEYPNITPKFLICLSDFTDKEKIDLIKSVHQNLIEGNIPLKLHQLPFIEAIDCSVTLQQSPEDEGFTKAGLENDYTCTLSSSSYKDMVEIIRHVGDGYNWLTPGEYLEEPAFLISKWRTW